MRTISIALSAAALVLAAAACGSDWNENGDGRSVAATTGILADITEQVAGPDATVEQVIPDGSSPHDFQLSAEDRSKIEDSVLLVHNGAGLESGVPIDEIDVPGFALIDNAGELLPLEEAGAHEEGHAEEEAHDAEEEHAEEENDRASDPHVWMDPTRVAAALPALADALADADPDHAEGYRSRAREYASELSALDRELSDELAAIPAGGRELVTSHDALGYFADRYGFEIVATPFPASGAEAEASAARLSEVEEAIRDTGVPTVFAEEGDDPEVLELIAGETGTRVEDGLLVESPGSAGSYVEMLRTDAELISQGLAASAASGERQ